MTTRFLTLKFGIFQKYPFIKFHIFLIILLKELFFRIILKVRTWAISHKNLESLSFAFPRNWAKFLEKDAALLQKNFQLISFLFLFKCGNLKILFYVFIYYFVAHHLTVFVRNLIHK